MEVFQLAVHNGSHDDNDYDNAQSGIVGFSYEVLYAGLALLSSASNGCMT